MSGAAGGTTGSGAAAGSSTAVAAAAEAQIDALSAIFGGAVPRNLIGAVLLRTKGDVTQAANLLMALAARQQGGAAGGAPTAAPLKPKVKFDGKDPTAGAGARVMSCMLPYGSHSSPCGYCNDGKGGAKPKPAVGKATAATAPAATAAAAGSKKSAAKAGKKKSRITFGADTPVLTPADYQSLCDYGWRRSGTYSYRPDNRTICCPQYTIRLDTAWFVPNKQQRKVARHFEQWLLHGDTPKLVAGAAAAAAASDSKAAAAGAASVDDELAPPVSGAAAAAATGRQRGSSAAKSSAAAVADPNIATLTAALNSAVVDALKVVAPALVSASALPAPLPVAVVTRRAKDIAVKLPHAHAKKPNAKGGDQKPAAAAAAAAPAVAAAATPAAAHVTAAANCTPYASTCAFALTKYISTHTDRGKPAAAAKGKSKAAASGSGGTPALKPVSVATALLAALPAALRAHAQTANGGFINFDLPVTSAYPAPTPTAAATPKPAVAATPAAAAGVVGGAKTTEKTKKKRDATDATAGDAKAAGDEQHKKQRKTNDSISKPTGAAAVKPKHTFELEMVPSAYDDASYAVYRKYQMHVHGDTNEDVTKEGYKRFLCDTPIIPDKINGYGSFHQRYKIDGQIVAVGVVDILPSCLSGVYFFYDPAFGHLSLGVLSALKEIDWVQRACGAKPLLPATPAAFQPATVRPDLRYYYMGYYVHSCPKMKYKAGFAPSELCCTERRTWHAIEPCLRQLDAQAAAGKGPYVVFSSVAPPSPAVPPAIVPLPVYGTAAALAKGADLADVKAPAAQAAAATSVAASAAPAAATSSSTTAAVSGVLPALKPSEFDAQRKAAARALLPDMRVVLNEQLMVWTQVSTGIQRQIEALVVELLMLIPADTAKRLYLRFNEGN